MEPPEEMQQVMEMNGRQEEEQVAEEKREVVVTQCFTS